MEEHRDGGEEGIRRTREGGHSISGVMVIV